MQIVFRMILQTPEHAAIMCNGNRLNVSESVGRQRDAPRWQVSDFIVVTDVGVEDITLADIHRMSTTRRG